MTLPNAHKAMVLEEKLVKYCLNPLHHRGRHKARLFRSLLGFTADDAPKLRNLLLAAAVSQEAQVGELDEFGQRYVVDFEVDGPSGTVTVRSAWIVRSDEDFARLTTCYVL